MQLCLNTSTICSPFVASTVPLPEKIRLVASAGFSHIELWNNELTEHEEQGGTLAEVKAMLDDHGLKVPTVITLLRWMETDGSEHRDVLEECRRRMAQAAAVGAPRIVATPPAARQPGWFNLDLDRAAARYREILDLGQGFDVSPAMEFLGFVSSVFLLETAWAIVELADHPRGSIVLDPFHLWRGGSGFRRVRTIPSNRIGVCHFNDAPADDPPRFEQADADRVYPGDGCLPLAAMLRDLAADGYDGALSLELFNPGYWALPPAENLRRGMEKTQAVLAAAGL